MNVQINSSEKLKKKLIDALKNTDIEIEDEGKIVLVENGYLQPQDKICIVFNPLEYVEVLKLLSGIKISDTFTDKTVTGFTNNRYSMINVKDISYFESEGSRVICVSGKIRYVVKETLNYYELSLKSYGIIRANKSQLVNLINVKEIIPWFNSRLVLSLKDNIEIEVSRLYSKALRNLLKL